LNLFLDPLKGESLITSKFFINKIFLDKNKLSVIVHIKGIIKKRISNNKLSTDQAIALIKYYTEFVLTSNSLNNSCIINMTATIKSLLNYLSFKERSKIYFLFFNSIIIKLFLL
jgi:hypothetical protein